MDNAEAFERLREAALKFSEALKEIVDAIDRMAGQIGETIQVVSDLLASLKTKEASEPPKIKRLMRADRVSNNRRQVVRWNRLPWYTSGFK